jgi:hypothetical protein
MQLLVAQFNQVPQQWPHTLMIASAINLHRCLLLLLHCQPMPLLIAQSNSCWTNQGLLRSPPVFMGCCCCHWTAKPCNCWLLHPPAALQKQENSKHSISSAPVDDCVHHDLDGVLLLLLDSRPMQLLVA